MCKIKSNAILIMCYNILYLGNSEIKPASEDEIARVIALTQQQMKSAQEQRTPVSSQVVAKFMSKPCHLNLVKISRSVWPNGERVCSTWKRFVVHSPAWLEFTLRIHYVQATSRTCDGATTLALQPMGRIN